MTAATTSSMPDAIARSLSQTLPGSPRARKLSRRIWALLVGPSPAVQIAPIQRQIQCHDGHGPGRRVGLPEIDDDQDRPGELAGNHDGQPRQNGANDCRNAPPHCYRRFHLCCISYTHPREGLFRKTRPAMVSKALERRRSNGWRPRLAAQNPGKPVGQTVEALSPRAELLGRTRRLLGVRGSRVGALFYLGHRLGDLLDWIPADCSCEALAILETSSSSFCECSRISINPWATRVLLATPAMLLCRDLSIFSALSFAAAAQRCASLRTSSATTANPSPASPPLAASIAAFSANRLVWKAISSMVLTILPTSSLDVFTLAMAALMASTALTPSATEACVLPASSFARAACSSLPRVTSAIWARDVLTSPVDAELSFASWASASLFCDTWPAAPVTWAAASRNSSTTGSIFPIRLREMSNQLAAEPPPASTISTPRIHALRDATP